MIFKAFLDAFPNLNFLFSSCFRLLFLPFLAATFSSGAPPSSTTGVEIPHLLFPPHPSNPIFWSPL